MTDAAERGYRSSPRGVRTRRAAIQRWILSAAALAPLMFGMGLLGPGVTEQILATSMEQVPAFELDPLWPRIPVEWKLGDVSSVAVDAHDHVWVLHRPRTLAPEDERMAAPPVLEFDLAGNVVRAWGGPADGLEWPEREHGIHVDDEQNVWIGGNNCVGRNLPGLKNVSDDQLLKLTETGRLVMQIGRSNSSRGNSDTMNLSQPSDVFVYAKTHEVFVAGRIHQSSCDRVRRGDRRVQADVGRVWQHTGRRSQMPTAVTSCRAGRRQSRSGAVWHRPCGSCLERWIRVCCRSRTQTRTGVYDRRYVRESGVHRQKHARRVPHGVLSRFLG